MIYASADLETTGLDRVNHDIVEFGCVLDDLADPEVPIDELPSFHCYNVLDTYTGSPYALSMHPTIFRRIATKEEGFTYCYNGKIGKLFREFLLDNGMKTDEHGKIHVTFAGKNFASFDMPFIQNHTDIEQHKIKIKHRMIDPGTLFLAIDDDEVPGTEECLRRAGLPTEVDHTAIEDSKDVIRLIRCACTKASLMNRKLPVL